MPFNGSGIFNLIFNWEADAAANIDIMASRMDQQEADMASSGFDNCLTRDGQGQPTANLPMSTFRHTNVGNGVNLTDYAALGQVQNDAGISWVPAGGSSDAITATFTPVPAALTDGQLAFFRATAANTTTTPTFAPNGLTAHTITKYGGAALVAGDIPAALAECILRYNLSNTRWELLNPATAQVGITPGVIDVEQIQVLSSANTLVNNTLAQPIFNATANGAITLTAATTYEFEMVTYVTGLPSASHSLSIIFAGSATLTSIGYSVLGASASDLTNNMDAGFAGFFNSASVAPIRLDTIVDTELILKLRGIVRINAGGTFIPQLKQTTASTAAIVAANSFFRCWPIGSNTVTNIGPWS